MASPSPQQLMDEHLRSIAANGADYWWHRHRYEMVRAWIPPGAARVLDYGCGSGTFLHWLAASAPAAMRFTGFDVAASTAALVGRQGGAAASVELLGTWPIAGAAFDCIVAMDVIEHVEDDGACLRSLAAALSAEGRLVVTVPAYQLFWSHWDVRLGHYRRYSPSELRQTLEQAGFAVEYMSLLFAMLCPLALLRRWSREPAAAAPIEFPPLPRWLNSVLRGLCRVERWALRWVNLPFGTSLFVVAKKRRAPAKLEVVHG